MKLNKICRKIFFRIDKTDLKYEEAMEIYKSGNAILIDVRTPEEYEKKHLSGAINIPIYEVENIEDEINDKDTVLLLYCKTGKRSKIVKSILLQNGYKNVYTFNAEI
ncbi:MAG: rhodanese-like domain-containing protein [Clostridia bacterium]